MKSRVEKIITPKLPDVLNIQRAKEFFEIYEAEKTLICGSEKIYIGNKSKKKCRFCNRCYPEVTFKNKAHLIPELMGNKNIVSHIECDNCNAKFGKYETDLSSYLHILRFFSDTKAKGNKTLKHYEYSSKNNISYKDSIVKNKDGSIIIEHSNDSETFRIISKNKIIIETTKQTYTPINVIKSFLRIALTLVEEDELKNLKNSFDFLLSDLKTDKFKAYPFFKLFYYFIPGVKVFETPSVSLWKKKQIYSDETFVDRTLIIKFTNMLYQMFIPFNLNDNIAIKKNQNIVFRLFPLINVSAEYIQNNSNYFSKIDDLSSFHKKYKEKNIIELKKQFSQNNCEYYSIVNFHSI